MDLVVTLISFMSDSFSEHSLKWNYSFDTCWNLLTLDLTVQPTHSNLFTMRHALLETRRFACNWNAFLCYGDWWLNVNNFFHGNAIYKSYPEWQFTQRALCNHERPLVLNSIVSWPDQYPGPVCSVPSLYSCRSICRNQRQRFHQQHRKWWFELLVQQ